MGFWQDLTGESAADAARQASQDQYGKQQSAIAKLLGYGDDYAANFRDLSTEFDPYVETGRVSNDALSRLIANPDSVRSLPGYQFDMDEGVTALDRSAASRGMLQSGRHSKDLMRFGTGLADRTYGTQLARLMGLNQQGMAATGAQTGMVGTGLQGQLGARTTAYGGDMNSAGTIGQGMIAGANARAAGSQNLLNTGIKLAGMAMGVPGGGGSFFGQSSFGGPSGNWVDPDSGMGGLRRLMG